MTSDEKGRESEIATQSWLRSQKINVRRAGRYAPFDLYTDAGTRIEVKTSALQKKDETWVWSFNIHRHGIVKNSSVDIYVMRLEPCEPLQLFGFNAALYVVIKAPIRGAVLAISPRSLLLNASDYCVNDVRLIVACDKRKRNAGVNDVNEMATAAPIEHISIYNRARKRRGI